MNSQKKTITKNMKQKKATMELCLVIKEHKKAIFYMVTTSNYGP